jgi:tRNA (guanine-N7-)-methyltransferase
MSDSASDPRASQAPRQRAIRSYVLRQGRQTEAQKRAFAEHWSRFGLDFHGQPRDFDRDFGRSAERVLEIGFGNGEQMLYTATREPERDLIGIEVHAPGVGRLLNGLAAIDAMNVRVYRHDAVEVLRHEIADASLAEVRIYFPDPWHKKRHHKRRLIQPDFIALLCDKLAAAGRLHLATDWADYAEYMCDVCEAEPRLRNGGDGPRSAVPCPDWRRQTHFESRGLKLGHGVRDILYHKR